MKKITKDIIDKINTIYKKAGKRIPIDPNYNLNDPFMFYADSADPYAFKSCSWQEMYDLFKDEINDAFNIHSLDEFKKINPDKIVERMDKYIGPTPELFSDFQGVNDLDSIFKENLAEEFSNPEDDYLSPATDRETAIKIHNEVAKLLGLEEYLMENNLTNDAKQKQICDSFSKRYKK